MIGEQCFDINECDDIVWQGTDVKLMPLKFLFATVKLR